MAAAHRQLAALGQTVGRITVARAAAESTEGWIWLSGGGLASFETEETIQHSELIAWRANSRQEGGQ